MFRLCHQAEVWVRLQGLLVDEEHPNMDQNPDRVGQKATTNPTTGSVKNVAEETQWVLSPGNKNPQPAVGPRYEKLPKSAVHLRLTTGVPEVIHPPPRCSSPGRTSCVEA